MTAGIATKPSVSDQVWHCRCLARALKLTEQMLAHADRGEWEQVARVELERREDLTASFSRAVPPGDAELVAEAMAALLHLNEELMSKLKVARTAALAQGRELAGKREAVTSYLQVESSSTPDA
ncbi:MAG: flagellar protein FliT [Halioglobus sp.]|nr:flagellar protein FliT [Halioglobus sp.]